MIRRPPISTQCRSSAASDVYKRQVYGVHASTAKQNRLALEYIIEGKLNVKKYIHNIFKLSDIKNAFESLKNEEIIKAIVKP